MMSLATTVREAREELDGIVHRVCGACGETCCHQGTMMGSADLRRLYKGLRLEPPVAARLAQGLPRRAREMAVEVTAAEQVTELLARQAGPDRESQVTALRRRVAEWRGFCDQLARGLPLEPDTLALLLRFSALRSNALRALREFPGAVEALADLVPDAPRLFLPGSQRLSAPRCVFHLPEGCLAGDWKPAKCANFYCAGEPNLLAEVAGQMHYEQFVRANFRALSPDQILRYVELELRLGREYLEPKVLVGANTALVEGLLAALRGNFLAVEEKTETGPFMWSTGEAEARLTALPANVAYVIRAAQVDGAALYELAVALDRLRIAGTPPAFYLLADRLSDHSFLPHPMWADRLMSQPLGALDLLVADV